MKANDIYDVTAELEREFGPVGSEGWKKAVEEAWDEYNAHILLEARKEAGMTQSEVAEKIGVSKAYISRLERAQITPSVTTFSKILNACGMRLEIVRTVAQL